MTIPHLFPITFPYIPHASVHLASLSFSPQAPQASCLQGSSLRLVLPLPAENLGVSALGLLCIGQNKPSSVTAPLKPKWFKNPLSGSAQTGVQETSADL